MGATRATSSESELWLNAKLAVYASGYFSLILLVVSPLFIIPPFLTWLGEKMNDWVIQKNNGYMPFRVPDWVPEKESLIQAFRRDPSVVGGRLRHGYCQMSEDTDMRWAGDIVAVPSPSKSRTVRLFSTGDLLSWFGGLLTPILVVITLI